MSIEDELRAALAAEAGRTDPPDAWDRIQEGVESERRRRRFRTAIVGGLAAAAVVAVVLLAVPMLRGDDVTRVETGVATPSDDDEPAPGPGETSDGVFPGLWPFADRHAANTFPDFAEEGFHGSEGVDYFDPEATALDFASEYLGFPEPVPVERQVAVADVEVGQAVVVLAPSPDSPLSTVVVLDQFGAVAWSVARAYSPNISVATGGVSSDPDNSGSTFVWPEASSPISVAGEATAFEGTIQIEVREDGMAAGESLGDGFATGASMGEMGPFRTSLEFDPPSRPAGALVLTTVSMEDGSVQEATVVRLDFRDEARPSPDTTETTDTTMPEIETPPATDGSPTFETSVCNAPQAPEAGEGEMVVWVFLRCEDFDPAAPEDALAAVGRVVPESPGVLRAALEALVAGPSTAERQAGLSSSFSDASAGTLTDVTIDGAGQAVVDFSTSLPSAMPNASASAASMALIAELRATVFQFGTVESVEFRLDGDCEAFWYWLQGNCTVLRRGDRP